MNDQTTDNVLRKMLVRGAIVWTVLFGIAVVLVAKPYIDEFVHAHMDGFPSLVRNLPSLTQIVLPTLLAGLLVAGFWICVARMILRTFSKRAWLAYLAAGVGSFATMVPVIAFVAMPDALWQLVSILGVTIAVLVAVRTRRTAIA